MKLKVATVQMTTDDRDKARVVDKVVRMIDEAGAQGADLIVLPEVWTGLGYADAYPFEAMASARWRTRSLFRSSSSSRKTTASRARRSGSWS